MPTLCSYHGRVRVPLPSLHSNGLRKSGKLGHRVQLICYYQKNMSFTAARMCLARSEAPTLVHESCSVLHDSMEACGIDTTHARAAREKFMEEVKEMWDGERQVSISKCMNVDLGRAALEIAAEDDALVSHSSVALPVDAFISRLDDLSMDFCRHFLPPSRAPPHVFLMNLERFMYSHKEFKRTPVLSAGDTRGLYLSSVLIHRTGSIIMLALIYAEIVKMLKIYGLLDVDIEIEVPHHPTCLPRGYISSDLHEDKGFEDKGFEKLKYSHYNPPNVITTQVLLTEILGNLKTVLWPFQYDPNFGGSLFLRAAYAVNCGGGPSIMKSESAFESYPRGVDLASAKAAEHRLHRGVWTSTRYGDLRHAMAACERLVLLGTDYQELRDYSILLYHCGLYDQSYKYLNQYCSSKKTSATNILTRNPFQTEEDTAVEKLMARLKLIMMEEGWSSHVVGKCRWGSSSEPW